ncbi:MAG: DUF4240 domain-containing protein [Bacteroidota bacterium]
MTARLKVNINQIDASFIQRLKEQFGDSTLEISIAPAASVEPMTEDQFWGIIDLLNWEEAQNEAILKDALNYLVTLPIAAIYRFQDMLCEKLYQLDGQRFAEQIGYGDTDEYFSVDEFLYARACVLANGKATYEAVLSGEMEFPRDLTFEPLLFLASNAYEEKTNKEFIHVPTKSYETFSNEAAWSPN